MRKFKFGEIVREVKINIDRNNNPYEYFIAGEHMDSEDVHIHRRGKFEGSDVGPAFIRLFKPGQILYGSRRTYLKKVAVADFEGITSNTTFVLESKDENVFCQGLLPFIMLSDDFTRYSISKSKGSTNPYILFSDLSDYELELPEIERQRELSTLLWTLDKTKSAYKKQLFATDELVKSQFIEMFGTIELEGKLPRKQWKEVLTIINGKDYKTKAVESGGYPVYGTGGEMARASEYLCPADSILMGRKGTIDNPLLIKEDFWNVDTAFGVVPNREILHYIYLYWYCKQLDFTKLNKATTLPSTTKNDLLNLWINIPEMDEQEQFARFVEQSDKSKLIIEKLIRRNK